MLLVKDMFRIEHLNSVDEYTPSIIVNGAMFIEGLECELSVEGVMTLTQALFISP